MLKQSDHIFVAGHTGMVGAAIVRALRSRGYGNLVLRRHGELDLAEQGAVREFFRSVRMDCVVLAAARVGGILANATYPAEFIGSNLAIEQHVIHEAWQAGVRSLVFLGSSCIYPRLAPQPLREDALLSGPLEPTNLPYAVAKIAGIVMCEAYNRQYGTRYFAVMPTNLYGPGDRYDLRDSHVLPALIRKMHEAGERGDRRVVLWGTGTPRREFLHCDDLAEAVLHLLERQDEVFALFGQGEQPLINIGAGRDITIAGLAEMVREVVGFRGEIVWDHAKPDGTPRKLLDISRVSRLGWTPKIGLRQGIAATYRDYLARFSGR